VDTAIPALLAVSVLVLTTMIMGRSGVSSFQTMGDAWRDAEERVGERIRSDITVTGVTVTGQDVDVVVRNDGDTEIVDFARMDVVLQYTSGDLLSGFTNNIVYLPFTDTLPQADNTWRVLVVGNDVIDPGIVNTGETLTLRLHLNPAVGLLTSNWVQVTTELGISASLFFTN
jgi:hypothetical protein